jgi:ATP-dependent DNA helicase recQ
MKESKTAYAYLIEHMDKPSFIKVWDIAYDFVRKLPSGLSAELHESLNRGIDVLDTEPLLQMYMYAFGKMHNAKLQFAFGQMHDRISKTERVQIIDYGCGQGLASICYHDFLTAHNPKQKITKIILVEPSSLALSRAELLCSCFYPNTDIVAVNKSFDNLNDEDIDVSPEVLTLHIFSNILDVESYDLQHLIHIVSNLKSEKNELVIVSPIVNEVRTQRLKTFAANFNGHIYYENYLSKRQLDEERDWTCSILLCSDVNGHELIKSNCDKSFEAPQSFNGNKNNNDSAEEQSNVIANRLLGDYYSNQNNHECDFSRAIQHYTKAGKFKDAESIKALIRLFLKEEYQSLFGNEQMNVFVLATKLAIYEVSNITTAGSDYNDSDGVRYACKGLVLTGSSYYKKDIGGELVSIRCVDKETYNIRDGVRIINNGAFLDCNKLRQLEIPASVNFIGANAFRGCYLPDSIKLPNSLVYIGDQAFAFTNRNPDYVENKTNPYVMHIPESVEIINGNPFCQNTIIHNNSPRFKVIDNVLYSADGKILISYCSNSTEFIIPEGVERIGFGAFRHTRIKNIKFPQSLEIIDEFAFSNTWIVGSITFPKSLKEIKGNAFYFLGRENIDFTFLSDKTNVAPDAFGTCAYLNLIKVPKGSLSHYRSIFDEWRVKQLIDENFIFEYNLYLNSDKTEIITTDFESYQEDINNVYIIPEGVRKIRDEAFSGLFYIQSIKFPKTLKYFSEEMFNEDVEISKIYVPIGHKNFYISKLPDFEDIIEEAE